MHKYVLLSIENIDRYKFTFTVNVAYTYVRENYNFS